MEVRLAIAETMRLRIELPARLMHDAHRVPAVDHQSLVVFFERQEDLPATTSGPWKFSSGWM